MNNLLGKGRSKLSSMDTTNSSGVGSGSNGESNMEEECETSVKEESPEAKELRLKKEFNEYQIIHVIYSTHIKDIYTSQSKIKKRFYK